MRESVGYWLHLYPHNNGSSNLIPEIHSTHVIKEQENTILKNKDNLSSVGTDRPPNH